MSVCIQLPKRVSTLHRSKKCQCVYTGTQFKSVSMYVIQNNPVSCDKFQNIGQSTRKLYIYDSSSESSYLIFYQSLVIASHCKLHNADVCFLSRKNASLPTGGLLNWMVSHLLGEQDSQQMHGGLTVVQQLTFDETASSYWFLRMENLSDKNNPSIYYADI